MIRNMQFSLSAVLSTAALVVVSQACGGSSTNSPQCNPACPAGQTCVYEAGTTKTTCQSSTASACTTDAQCLNGQTCQSGTCKSAGTPCTTDAQCLNGQSCQGGLCKPKASGCASDSQCPTGQTCQGGACKSAGTPCTTDTQCLNGQSCQGGFCKAKTGCTSDSQCPTGQTCQGGACKAPPSGCTSDSQCPTGQRCNNGQCAASTTGPQTCVDLINCMGACSDTACKNSCLSSASSTAVAALQALSQCSTANSCNGDGACLQQKCASQYSACSSPGSTGPQTCVDLINCMGACSDTACKNSCLSSASSTAVAALQALSQCSTANSCNGDGACLQQKCPSQYSACSSGSTSGKTCTELVQCWVDSACDINAAFDAAPAGAQSQFSAVVQCTQSHNCTTGQCIQENCTAELNACQ